MMEKYKLHPVDITGKHLILMLDTDDKYKMLGYIDDVTTDIKLFEDVSWVEQYDDDIIKLINDFKISRNHKPDYAKPIYHKKVKIDRNNNAIYVIQTEPGYVDYFHELSIELKSLKIKSGATVYCDFFVINTFSDNRILKTVYEDEKVKYNASLIEDEKELAQTMRIFDEYIAVHPEIIKTAALYGCSKTRAENYFAEIRKNINKSKWNQKKRK